VKKWAGDGRGGRAADAKCLSLSFFYYFLFLGFFWLLNFVAKVESHCGVGFM
jgi:hypothetical protein